MADGKDQDRTERATPKRRRDAREKGQVAHSKELSSVVILLSVIGVFHFGGIWMTLSLTQFTRGFFQNLHGIPLEMVSVPHLMRSIAETFLHLILPVFSAVLAAGLAANILQVGFRLTAEPIKPNLAKLDPVKGIRRLVSLRSLAELIKSILKIVVVGATAWLVVRTEAAGIPSLMRMEVIDILLFIGRVSQKIAVVACLVLILLSLSDYLFQRWQFEKDLRMSKQEIKEEFKQREGDPLIRARIRRIQTEMARHRMMVLVPEADVVITNPTHFAVALKYKPQEMVAPKVIAKGAGFVAERIKQIAAQSDIPMVENKPLAQALFKSVQIGAYIPAELYRAVAEILAYVYSLRRK